MIYLYAIAAIALTVPGFVLAVRALPRISKLVLSGMKPWSCDVCMCFWSTLFKTVLVSAALQDWRVLLCAGPAYTVALLIIGFLERPTAYPPPPEPEHHRDIPEPQPLADELEP